MKLTAKQEAFAQLLANGSSQAEAYRKVYAAAKMKPATVWEAASRIASDSKVTARVDELKGALAEKHLWTREKSVQGLADVAAEGRAMERVAAIKELNSMHGFNEPVKHDVRVVGSIKMVPLGR